MSSQQQDDHDGIRARNITHAIDEAQLAIADYKQAKLQYADRGHDPDDVPEVRDMLIDVHTAVIEVVFARLRAYIKKDLEDKYWHTTEYPMLWKWLPMDVAKQQLRQGQLKRAREAAIEAAELSDETPISRGDRSDGDGPEYVLIGGLQVLDDYTDLYRTRRTEQWDRYGGRSAQTTTEVTLLDADAYQRILKLLDECRRELGFGPRPQNRHQRVEITKEDMNEFEEWRQEMYEEYGQHILDGTLDEKLNEEQAPK